MNDMEGVRFYCGINEDRWNHHPVTPGGYACVSPVYGGSKAKENRVFIPDETLVIQDSGAFSDNLSVRLSKEEALYRQVSHGEKYKYTDKITHRASYDVLIDEVWVDGNRYKRRWAVQDAEFAVQETIDAAKFMAYNKDRPAILSAQGVDDQQYLSCVQQVVDYLDHNDILGLGGWCIIGKQRKVMMPVFVETLRKVIPFIAKKNIKWVHIWGVVFPKALGALLWSCDQFDIKVSTDSAGPSYKPALGSWGYGDWRDGSYKQPPVEIRGLERIRHVEITRNWLNNLRNTQYYKSPF